MTINEAIQHLDESIPHIRAGGCEECAQEHEQLKAWLEELVTLRAHQEAEKNEPPRYAERVRIFDDPRTGRLFTTCSCCQGKVGPHDKFCKHCGREFLDISRPPEKEEEPNV